MLEAFAYFYLFIVGLVLGSFYNVVGIRTADKQSIAFPRSHCPSCKRTLSARELIPVFSYIWQKGRCRGCQMKVSLKYPFFELVTAVLFTISPLLVGWSKELLIVLLLVSLVVIVTISDLYKMLIPNRVLLFFTLVTLGARLVIPSSPWWDAYAGAVLGFLVLFLIAIVSKGGMGFGDVKYFAVLGLFLGMKNTIFTLIFAAFFGTIVGGVLIALKKHRRNQPLPFAPFIGAGALISYFYGDALWQMYVSLFHS